MMFDMMFDNMENYKMKNLVDISTMVTQSLNFFEIKDKIIEKMLEVVHPTKSCVNLFYNNNYKYAYLVCSETLDKVPDLYDVKTPRGIRIDFNEYPRYIHEAVEKKQIIYIENIFEDERAIDERELAKTEGYVGRIVFPLVVNYNVVGFMTCFLTNEDKINQYDIDFISSVASLISLSIDITMKNNNNHMLVLKLRGAISSINEATEKLYFNNNISEFLDHLSKQACHVTNSKEAIIITEKSKDKKKIFSCYSIEGKNQTNIYPTIGKILSQDSIGAYCNENKLDNKEINSYIYYKIKDKDSKSVIGYIVCANSSKYTEDDLNILSILARQLSVALKLYQYNLVEIKHKIVENELDVLNKQQKLIMNESKIKYGLDNELNFYHRPAKVVGGDFYSALKLDDEKIVCILADVMGHGIVSNYVVAIIKGAFKVLARTCNSPGEIMTNLNDMLYDEFDKMGIFTTCLVGMIDTKKNTITISNAGHYSPIVIKKDASIKRDLNCKKGIPIGVLENVTYENNVLHLDECSMVCMYTDGILEIKNKLKEEYGVSRLESFMQKNYTYSQELIVENLKAEIKKFSEKENYDDDILIVMLKNN
ncbi:GAF domain-containing SpoIIE family protein phosphatase [Romboutsia sp. 13368]|uniref:GAF domain-containing SpoIIE family protein phosphatase n=1 Tax=Romboutsia sp. 13368 TaxID=2708053 RepID=UPI0025CCBF0B|nr:SpoIIE family protein phosphatase [Romboutsia sp. 13368]